MSFIAACGLARTAGGHQLRAALGLAARSQQQPAALMCSVIHQKEIPKGGSVDGQCATAATANLSSRTHAPNNFEKRLLVFTKKYKSVDEIPAFINQEMMERCRNQMRIKVANYMMVATVVGCIIMIISGKKAQERGESVAQMNLDWHSEYNAKANAENAASKN